MRGHLLLLVLYDASVISQMKGVRGDFKRLSPIEKQKKLSYTSFSIVTVCLLVSTDTGSYYRGTRKDKVSHVCASRITARFIHLPLSHVIIVVVVASRLTMPTS